jgi:hypothetical protein
MKERVSTSSLEVRHVASEGSCRSMCGRYLLQLIPLGQRFLFLESFPSFTTPILAKFYSTRHIASVLVNMAVMAPITVCKACHCDNWQHKGVVCVSLGWGNRQWGALQRCQFQTRINQPTGHISRYSWWSEFKNCIFTATGKRPKRCVCGRYRPQLISLAQSECMTGKFVRKHIIFQPILDAIK